ncbi:hypothetical protein [Myxosarcina sp. GI1(2024)]
MQEVIDFDQYRAETEEVKRGNRSTAQEKYLARKAKEQEKRLRERELTVKQWELEDRGVIVPNNKNLLDQEERDKMRMIMAQRRERMAKTVHDAKANAHAQAEQRRIEALRSRNHEAVEILNLEIAALEERMDKKLSLILERLDHAK